MRDKYLGRYLFAFITCALLAGCNITPDHPLSPHVIGKINSTDVYILIPQEEISFKIKESKLKRFGAGAISFAVLSIADTVVEKKRTTKAENFLKPLKKLLDEVDFGDIFAMTLTQSAKSNSWMNIKNVHLVTDLDEGTKASLFHRSMSDAVLFLTTSYHFDEDFNALSASALSELIPKASQLKDYAQNPTSGNAKRDALHPSNHLYRESLSFQVPLPTQSDRDEEKIDYLIANELTLRSKLIELAALTAVKTNDHLASFSLLSLSQ